MSNLQNMAVTPTQTGFSNMCLTGCVYQVVQNPGVQGRNLLQLIPVIKAKDNPLSVFRPPPLITNTPVLNVQQPVRLSLPSASRNVPCPVNAQLIQQLGSANYIITTQKNPADTSKTIRVDNKLSGLQNPAAALEKPQVNFPPSSQAGAPSFIIMNTKPAPVPAKTIPIFPAGHALQIPNHAEVKSVPASSLPFSVQQRILPPNTSNDASKIPSVIYVSPVNTVKTPPASSRPNNSSITAVTQSSPVLVPNAQPSTTTPAKGPLKWVVQETTESKPCIVPVKSSSDTALKLLTLMSGAKTEKPKLTCSTGSDITKIKDNTLVMCNNKIYFLTKQADELRNVAHVKQESPEKTPLQTEQGKDVANKVVEVVLSKNSVPPPSPKQASNSGSSPLLPPDSNCPAKPKPSTPTQVGKNITNVIYIDDDEDVAASAQKQFRRPKATSSVKVFTPSGSLDCGPRSSENQIKVKETEMTKMTKPSTSRVCDDRTLRAKFGIFKQEKVILGRIPLLRPESKSSSRSPSNDAVVYTESQEKRKSPFVETSSISKRRKSADTSDFSMNTATADPAGNYSRTPYATTVLVPAKSSDMRSTTSVPVHAGPSGMKGTTSVPVHAGPSGMRGTTSVPVHAGPSDTKDTTSGERTLSFPAFNETEPNTSYGDPSSSHSGLNLDLEMYADHSESHSFYVSPDITGHLSEAPLPRQRSYIEPSAYPDETTKDEKIQRLKEVLREREQALEALRRQKWS